MQRGSDAAQPVASRLGGRGITSAAVVGYFSLRATTTGFGTVKLPGGRPDRWSASEVTDLGLAELRAPAPPQYLWLHYFDAHVPYPAIPADLAVPAIAYPSLAYLARLAFIDREIGRLLDVLDLTSPGRTAFLVTADHGEGLGEHGVEYHGVTTYESIVHVPAFLVAPGVAPGTHDGVASHRDVAATILGAFGAVAGSDAELFGRSWLRLRAEPGAALHRFVVTRSAGATTLYHGFASPTVAIVEGRYKFAKSFGNGFRVMFDVNADPGEEHNVEPEHPEEARAMERELELYRDLDAYP